MEIRRAETRDVPEILEMGRAMHNESPSLCRMAWSDVMALALINGAISNRDAIAIVAEDDGQIVGMFGGAVTKHMFSDELVAMDYVLYVRPAWRGQDVGRSLVGVYVEWALARGVRMIQAGVTSGINTDEAVRLYETCGFRVGGYYMTYGG